MDNPLVAKILNGLREEYKGSALEFKKLNDTLNTLCNAIQASQSDLKLGIGPMEVIKLKGRQGDKGKDGKTPKKGIDYLTEKELLSIKEEVRPKKGKDYFTDLDITEAVERAKPKKGTDYFTDKEIDKIVQSVKKLIRVPKDGKQGKKGDTPKLPPIKEIAKLVKIAITEKDGKEIVQAINAITVADNKYKIDAKHIKGIKAVIQNFYGGGTTGPSGSSTFIGLTDVPATYVGQASKGVRVNAGATALEFYTVVDTDEKASVQADDVAGYLSAKVIGGTGITATVGGVVGARTLALGFTSSNISQFTNNSGYLTTTAGGDHGGLAGLGDDDHTQYALLAGRSGGQTLIGGTASGNDLTLQSTVHATKGNIFFGAAGLSTYDEVNNRLGIGTNNPLQRLDIKEGNINFTRVTPAAAATVTLNGAGVLTGTYRYSIQYKNVYGETNQGTLSAFISPSSQQVQLGLPISTDPTVTGRVIYRTAAGGSTLFLLATVNDNTTATYNDNTADGSLSATLTTNFNDNFTGGWIYLNNVKAGIITDSSFVIGKGAGASLQSNAEKNILIGLNAGGSITYGQNNVIIGSNTAPNYNGTNGLVIGSNAATNATTGGFNTIVGTNSAGAITTQSELTIFGFGAYQSATGIQDTVFGINAMNRASNGANLGMGYIAMQDVSGYFNTAVGSYQVAATLRSGIENTFLGTLADVSSGTISTSMALGKSAIVGASNNCAIGGTGANAVDIISGGTIASAKLHLIKTTEQLRLGYDASNYLSATIDSAGNATLNLVGTSPVFTFSDRVGVVTGAAAKVARVGGKIKEFITSVGNVGTGEDDLYSYTTEAAILAVDGDELDGSFGLKIATSGGTATRQIKLWFGGTAIFDTTALLFGAASNSVISYSIIRVSSTAVRYRITLTTTGATLAAYTAVGELTGLTLSGTNVLKLTGEAAGVGAATDDIISHNGDVFWWPAST